jgi:hypothetical protein
LGYSLDFILNKKLTLDNVYEVLEMTDPSATDDHYVSPELMESLISEIEALGIPFELFTPDEGNYFELNFPTYQVMLYSSEVVISVPYWDDNADETIDSEIKQISNILLKNNFTGFDSQTEEFIDKPYQFQETFTETLEVVNESNTSTEETGNTLLYVGLALGAIIISFIIWKILNR